MKKLFLATFIAFFAISSHADFLQNQKLYAAANTVKAFACKNFGGIPAKLVKDAVAVAIIPDLKKAAIGVSVSSGEGVFSMKDEYGNWSSPLFIKYRGWGVGIQAGYESKDLVILFQSSKSFQQIFNGEDSFEINAGATLGHGMSRGSATDLPDISAWGVQGGKSTGIFVGVSIDNGKISIDDQATNDFYGRIYDVEDILNNSPKETKYIRTFQGTLAKYLGDTRYYYNCSGKVCNAVSGSDNKEIKASTIQPSTTPAPQPIVSSGPYKKSHKRRK